MTDLFDLITFGEAMVQLNASSPGPLRHVRTFEKHAAGSELNCAIAASRLGLRTAWIGKLGCDEMGEFILATARSEGVDTSAVVRDEDAPTGLFLIQRGYPLPDSSSSIYYRTGSAGSRLLASELDGSLVATGRMLHFSGISLAVSKDLRDSCWAVVDKAAETGSTISFDVNFRRKLWEPSEGLAEIERALSVANIAFCGFDDAATLFGIDTPEAALDALRSYGPQRVVVTTGAEGALMWSKGRVVEGKARRISVVDPTGAGDALAATVLAGLVHGWSDAKTIDLACTVGSIVCSVAGDFEGVPTKQQLEALQGDSWVPR
jgi:sugar/nucleoside kinase (ribokinase family)